MEIRLDLVCLGEINQRSLALGHFEKCLSVFSSEVRDVGSVRRFFFGSRISTNQGIVFCQENHLVGSGIILELDWMHFNFFWLLMERGCIVGMGNIHGKIQDS